MARLPSLLPILGLFLVWTSACAGDSAGQDAVEPPTPDAGLPPGTGVVPKELTCDGQLEPFEGHVPACSYETRACVEACGEDDACVGECIAQDATGPSTAPNGLILDCRLCVAWQTVYCVESAGCRDEAADLSCCRSTRCAGVEDVGTCSAENCVDQRRRYGECLSQKALHCINASTDGAFATCFAEEE